MTDMPMRGLTHHLRSLLGWFRPTPIEWILILAVASLVYWGAFPRYESWRYQQLLRKEQVVVHRVRNVLAERAMNNRRCPAQADTCGDGNAEGCGFFGMVLPEPISEGWVKAQGVYVGPAGGRYRYVGESCQFLQTDASGTVPNADGD